MDKKTKKRLDVLRQRAQKLQQQISGAKQQNDEPEQLQKLEQELADVKAEVERLKNG